MLSGVNANQIFPAILLEITFRSETVYVWSGIGQIAYGGNTYQGVGALGSIEAISESTEVKSEGTVVRLSGIDPTLLSESLTDIQVGAPAIIYFALTDGQGNFTGTPYMQFRGTVDKSSASISVETMSISIALENRLSDLQRAQQQRYTAADQHVLYSQDTGFNWVEQLNDEALRWGN